MAQLMMNPSNSETDNNNNNNDSNKGHRDEDSPSPPPLVNCKSNTTSTNLEPPIFPIALKFEEIVYKVKLRGSPSPPPREKTILNNLSGTVSPGEILAMLGPSGSGKTTLLTALGGRLHGTTTGTGRLSGKITYNGQPFSSSVKRHTGFVAQDDVLYPHLTVHETLHFTALLRLPSKTPNSIKSEQVERVIEELGLNHCRDSMVGGPLVRGISGGEKKRVSIGQEMLLNPSLLLLDEPTSGLDSTTAMRILCMVKRLANDGGRTVVTTIHQPSSRLYHMFDKVVVLSQGCPIYYGLGSAALDYFSDIGFFDPDLVNVNPADVMLDLASGLGPYNNNDSKQSDDNYNAFNAGQEKMKSVRDALISAYDEKISPKLKTELRSLDIHRRASEVAIIKRTGSRKQQQQQWNTTWWVQFKVLVQRGMKERRFEAFNKLRIFQVISVATLGGLLWWRTPQSHIQDRIALLFFFTVFWGFYPLYNAVFTFPQERRTLIKERSSGMYRLSSYFLARTIGDLPLELALPTAFVVIIYWMAGLKPNFGTFVLSLLVVLYNVLVAQSLGLAIGAVLMDIKPATTLASVTTLVFLMAGGYYVQQIPMFIVWLKYLSYSYYCYKLLLGVQYDGNDLYECSEGSGVYCRVGDVPFVKSMGLTGLWVDVGVLTVMLVGYRLVAYLALQRVR